MKPITQPERAKAIENQLRGVIAASGLSATQLAELITKKCDRPEVRKAFHKNLNAAQLSMRKC